MSESYIPYDEESLSEFRPPWNGVWAYVMYSFSGRIKGVHIKMGPRRGADRHSLRSAGDTYISFLLLLFSL